MPIPTTCPHCAASESFPDTEAGKTVNCSACGGAIDLPRAAAVAVPAKPVAAAVVAQAKPIAAAVVAQAKPIAAAPVAKAPVVLKAKSKPAVDLDDEDEKPRKKSKSVDQDEEDDRPRKKSKPAVDLDEDEEKPRKKSKPVVDLDQDEAPAPKSKSQPEFAFDDEPDAVPKKKKKPRDDDDEDDERPRRKPAKKKGGSGKILIILGGIAFLLFAGCAGGGYWFYIEAEKSVASLKSQMTVPTEPGSSKPTKASEEKPGPNLKENAAKVSMGDTYKVVLREKMGDTRDCRMQDLETWKKLYTGADKVSFDGVLDYYAPWVDKGCAKLYHNTVLKYRVIVVYGDKAFDQLDNLAMVVKGLLSLDESGGDTTYSEQVTLTRFPDSDTDGARLGLKKWVGLKENTGTGVGPTAALKDKAVNITLGDTLQQVETRMMAPSSPYTLDALKADLAKYKKPAGEGADVVPAICDRFAPWIDKNCALVWRENDFCAVVVFGVPVNKPIVARRKFVKGVFWFDEKDGVGEFKEQIPIATDFSADADARALNLKPYKNLKEAGAGTDPPKPDEIVKITATDLAAEVLKDRQAAAKKYEGATLEITGEVNSKSATGSVLILKAGTDENTMKSLIVPVSMKVDQREAAKKCNLGDTVTVTGTLALPPTITVAIPVREGVFKK